MGLHERKIEAGFLDRARSLPKRPDLGVVRALVEDVGQSPLPNFICKKVLDAIAKRSGIERKTTQPWLNVARRQKPPAEPPSDPTDCGLFFGKFDLVGWKNALKGPFDFPALMSDKGLVRDAPEDDEISDAIGVYVTCPFQDEHEDVDEASAFCGLGHETSKFVLTCYGGEKCEDLSYTEEPLHLLKAYLESGLITPADLENPKYGGAPVPRAAPPLEEPAGLPEGFVWHVDGKIYTVDAKDGEGQEHFVCGHIVVAGHARDEHGIHIGYQIEFEDKYNARRKRILTERRMVSEGSALFDELRTAGLAIGDNPTARAAFRKLLAEWQFDEDEPTPIVTVLSRPGWHGEIFVTPLGEVIAPDGRAVTDRQLNPDVTVTHGSQAGSADAWLKLVSIPSWKGDKPQFALGMMQGLVGVLSSLYGGENAGRYFGGATSSGKTTSQTIGASCVANPSPGKGVLITAKATDEEFKLARLRAHGTCLHIDEAKNATERKFVEKLAYGGRDWTGTPYTLSGVKPVHAWVEKAGGDTEEGIETRLLPVDVGKLPRAVPSEVDAIDRAAKANYGWALPSFVEEVIAKGLHKDAAALRGLVETYARKLATDVADVDAHRASKHFGVLWLTGELMHAAGIIPENADVERVVRWAWNDWQASRGFARKAAQEAAEGGSDVERSLKALDAFVASRRGPARLVRTERVRRMMFPLLAPSTREIVGWADDGDLVYLKTDCLGAVPGLTIGARQLVNALRAEERLILPTSTRNCAWTHIPGLQGDFRHYRFKGRRMTV